MKANIIKIKLISFSSEFTLYAPVLALYFLSVGLTLGEIVVAQVFYSLGMLVGEVPAGMFSDKYGRKKSILIGHALDTIGILALLVLPSATILYGINLLRGLGGAFLSGSYEALLYESVLEEKELQTSYAKVYASVLSLATLGFVSATAITAPITGMFGETSYYWLILATAVAQLISLLIALTLTEESRTVPLSEKIAASSTTLFKEGIRLVYNNHVVFYLTLTTLLTINGEYFLRDVYQPLLLSVSTPVEYLGLILSAGAILNFVVVRYFHALERFFTLPQLLLIIYLGTALGYLVLSTSGNPVVLSGATLLLFGIFNIDRPLISEHINEHLPNSVRTTALSTVSLTGSLGKIVQRIFLASILDRTGVGTAMMAQSVLLIIGTAISFWAMARCGCVKRKEALLPVPSHGA